MVSSMTAFARADRQAEWGLLNWELRSVNHRYLELSLRLPEEFRMLEPAARELIGKHLRRGKLEGTLRYKPLFTADSRLTINSDLAEQVVLASREIDHLINNPAPVNAMDIMRWPGVLQSPEPDWEEVRVCAMQLLEEALVQLVEARNREGNRLDELIRARLDAMDGIVAELRGRLPGILQQQRERLLERISELRAEVDEARFEQEIALLAQKIDVAEEIDRLEIHVAEVRNVLTQDPPVGRRLDFMMQELNREANTLGSKSVDPDTTRASVEFKVLIEQMREQVQNIE